MVYMMDDAIQYIRSVESIELPTPKMTTDEGIVNKIVVDSASMSHVWLTVFDKLANEKGHVMQYKFKAFQNKNKIKHNLDEQVRNAVYIDHFECLVYS